MNPVFQILLKLFLLFSIHKILIRATLSKPINNEGNLVRTGKLVALLIHGRAAYTVALKIKTINPAAFHTAVSLPSFLPNP